MTEKNKSMTLTELLDYADRHAHRILIQQQRDQITPVFLFQKKDGTPVFVATPWSSPAEKNLMIAGVKDLMRQQGAVRYSFLTEAWASDTATSDKPPSQQPDRWEMVIALAADGVNQEYRWWRIQRDRRARVKALVPIEMNKVDQINTWLANLLGGTA